MNAQDLKNSILQLAIQGKLVEQREDEGTAKELIKLIMAEKERLNNEKKIKIDEFLAYDSNNEELFEIPETWQWVRLTDILNFVDYRGKTPSKINSGVVLITASNVKSGYLDFAKSDFISEIEYNERMSRGITQKGDILFTTEAPLGNVAINSVEIASCGQRVITLQQYGEKQFSNELICYFLLSPYFQRELINNATGTTAKGIKAAKLKNMLIPFPPINEQKRIVDKIEELMPYIDKYGESYLKLEALNKKFPEDMQKSILQYAIQGKLVEQRTEEGTAEELYQQIQAEKARLVKEGKIKKDKSLPEITEDEIPFEIPESWKWVRLGAIVSILGDGIHGTPEYDEMGDFYFINGNNLNNGTIEFKDNTKRINKEQYDKHKRKLTEKSILISINGTIGNVAFYNGEKVILGKSACYLNLVIEEIKYYLYWIVKSCYFLDYATNRATRTTIKNVSLAAIREMPIPLPPLNEQKRIVIKIKDSLPYVDKLINDRR